MPGGSHEYTLTAPKSSTAKSSCSIFPCRLTRRQSLRGQKHKVRHLFPICCQKSQLNKINTSEWFSKGFSPTIIIKAQLIVNKTLPNACTFDPYNEWTAFIFHKVAVKRWWSLQHLFPLSGWIVYVILHSLVFLNCIWFCINSYYAKQALIIFWFIWCELKMLGVCVHWIMYWFPKRVA